MLRVFELMTDEGTQWLLSADQLAVARFAAAGGGIVIDDHDPTDILERQYQGIACLNTL